MTNALSDQARDEIQEIIRAHDSRTRQATQAPSWPRRSAGGEVRTYVAHSGADSPSEEIEATKLSSSKPVLHIALSDCELSSANKWRIKYGSTESADLGANISAEDLRDELVSLLNIDDDIEVFAFPGRYFVRFIPDTETDPPPAAFVVNASSWEFVVRDVVGYVVVDLRYPEGESVTVKGLHPTPLEALHQGHLCISFQTESGLRLAPIECRDVSGTGAVVESATSGLSVDPVEEEGI